MKDENSVREELQTMLEKQIENVKKDDVLSYIMTNSKIVTLAHILELDLINRIVD